MLIIEEVSCMSKSGYNNIELLEYMSVNLMEMSIKNPNAIIIFALTATWR